MAEESYLITGNCIQCGKCKDSCPTNCIIYGSPYKISDDDCVKCGICFDTCPINAIVKT